MTIRVQKYYQILKISTINSSNYNYIIKYNFINCVSMIKKMVISNFTIFLYFSTRMLLITGEKKFENETLEFFHKCLNPHGLAHSINDKEIQEKLMAYEKMTQGKNCDFERLKNIMNYILSKSISSQIDNGCTKCNNFNKCKRHHKCIRHIIKCVEEYILIHNPIFVNKNNTNKIQVDSTKITNQEDLLNNPENFTNKGNWKNKGNKMNISKNAPQEDLTKRTTNLKESIEKTIKKESIEKLNLEEPTKIINQKYSTNKNNQKNSSRNIYQIKSNKNSNEKRSTGPK
ncbi:uncharacterized protein LOC126895084 [Daktulosphaira vitifoliae]|uniref:uncharacterized protein LOC126895084 n=1 Tax=Daktulosphaira vitifoliae TaxID=58002 RepID=UPI0021AA6050|nr:uncharacterized protein LOC126895084 [Daktulosphaira vitifoliae]